MRRLLLAGFICGALVALSSCVCALEQTRLPATRDTWVSGVGREAETNCGKVDRLKLKDLQELAIVDFDTKPIAGKRIRRAWLYMHSIKSTRELARLGLPTTREDALRKIGVSTLAGQWVEGQATRAYQRDERGHGATFNEASFGRLPWAWPGSRIWDVIMGNGHTLQHHATVERQGGGWWRIPVPLDLIYARAVGASYGFVIMDESGQLLANNYVHSRESGRFAPYLLVETEGPLPSPPRSAVPLRCAPDEQHATLTSGALKLTVRPPAGAFAYFITVGGKNVPRWQIPFATPGAEQSFSLRDLTPGRTTVKLEVRDRAGRVIAQATAPADVSRALAPPPKLPALPQPRTAPKPPPARSGLMRVWAYPEVCKVDPLTGQLMHEPAAADYRARNAVWDASTGTVRLCAARGEIVAFQVAIERLGTELRDVRVVLGPLRSDAGEIPQSATAMYRTWYVKAQSWEPEYAVPLSGPFSIPAQDNSVPGQRVQSVYVDLLVPKSTPAGVYRGTLAISAQGVAAFSLGVQLRVFDVVIPDELNFAPELNCYSGPGTAGSEKWWFSHKLAHAHRCTINRVPYSQSGNVHPDLVPKIAGSGANCHVVDWRTYDEHVGPLLDGSAFADCPRAGVPVPVMYLPFHENWPSPINKHYAYKGPPTGPKCIALHAIFGPPIEQAFSEEYKAAFVQIVREFAEHFVAKGWTKTRCQIYLNNKDMYRARGRGTSWWCLDEPRSYDDWMALRFFSQMVHRALADVPGHSFVFRGDISRPQWQFNWMDGLMEMMYVNSSMFGMVRRCRIAAERMPCALRVYGSCNDIGSANHQTTAWCLKAYVAGADGVLPWQSLAGERALVEPDRNGLIVDGQRFGVPSLASLRVKALRRGAQDVELLRLVGQKFGFQRDQLGALVAQKIALEAQFRQQFFDEAAPAQFAELSGDAFVELRCGLLLMLQ